jgi:PAS domain S-box-containing protein
MAEVGPTALVIGSALLVVGAAVALLVLQLGRRNRAANASRFTAADVMALLRGHPGIVLLLDAGRVIEANDQAQRAYGYTLAELRALPPGALQSDPAAPAAGSTAPTAPEPRTTVTTHRRKDGSPFPVEVSMTLMELTHGRCVLQTCRDLSAEQEPRRQYERISQLYAILRQLNQGMIRAENREDLEQGVCNALVGPGRFQIAWIGWLDPASSTVSPSAMAGEGFADIDDIVVRTDDRSTDTDPSATAIREKRTCVSNRLARDPAPLAARESPAPQRVRASIALPLRTIRGTVGAMAVYAAEPDTFQAEEIALLEQCAADLCFALDSLDEAASHRLAEERLVLLGSALEGAPDAIAISDHNDTIEWVNPAFLANSGYTAEEVIGRNSRQLRAEHHPTVTESELWRTISTGQAWHGELVSRRKNGQLYIEDTSIVPVRDRGGQIRNFVSIRQDVTGRKGAEQRVREQAALLDQASEAIVVADLNHRVSFWNRGAERLFGFTAVEALGRQLREVLPLESTIGSADFLHAMRIPVGNEKKQNQA